MKICPVCNNREPGDDASFCSFCGHRFDEFAFTEDDSKYTDNSIRYKGYNIPGRDQDSVNKQSYNTDKYEGDRPVRQKWPFIVGGAALVIIIVTAVFFFISDRNLLMSQEKQIQDHFSHIENLRNNEKENYLEEALTDFKGDDFYEKAKEIKDDEDISKEQQISSLKEIKENYDKYDDELVSRQTSSLNKEYSKVQGQYKKEFLIEGEQEKIEAFEKEYGENIDNHLFKDAKSIIESYGELEKKIASNDESENKYSAKHLLDEDEFMPTILDFSVFDESYTNNGEAMGADHFTLIEQIGENGKQKYINIDKVSMTRKNDEYMYVLKFTPSKPNNYTKGRGYALHVRNMDGTRGFTTNPDKTIPEKKIEKAVAEYMEDFVRAFNEDNDENSRSFNKMKGYLEKDSQAWNDYKDQPSKDRIVAEGITGQENPEVDISEDHSKATVHVTFNYEIGRYRRYDEIYNNTIEDNFCHDGSTSNKDYRIYSDYVIYMRGGEYRGQELSDSSRFLCHESLRENETFVMNLTNNSVGKITNHDNDKAEITSVSGMSYQVDGSRHEYSSADLDLEEEEYYVDDAHINDDYDDEEYEYE